MNNTKNLNEEDYVAKYMHEAVCSFDYVIEYFEDLIKEFKELKKEAEQCEKENDPERLMNVVLEEAYDKLNDKHYAGYTRDYWRHLPFLHEQFDLKTALDWKEMQERETKS